jgi:hypothetical protein
MIKKIRSIGLTILFVIVNFNLVFADHNAACSNYPYSNVSANPINRMALQYLDPIILDGMKDIAYTDSFRLNSIVYFPAPSGESQYVPADYHDNGAVISIGWREEGIYLFARISDDKDFGGANWSQDGMQIDINVDTADDDACGNWTVNDWEIGINRDTNIVRYSNASQGNAFHAIIPNCIGFEPGADTGRWGSEFIYYGQHIPGVKFAMTNNNYKGYTIEACYPWGFLCPGVLVDSIIKRTMGFDIAVADNDASFFPASSGGRDHSLIWDQDGGADSNKIQTALPINADAVNQNSNLMGRITFQPRFPVAINKVVNNYTYRIFPNPANEVVNIGNLKNVVSLEFINICGQIIKNIQVSSADIQVQISDLEKGVYLIRTRDISGKVDINKLVVR